MGYSVGCPSIGTCLMLSSCLDWGYGFAEEEHGGEGQCCIPST